MATQFIENDERVKEKFVAKRQKTGKNNKKKRTRKWRKVECRNW